MSWRDKEPTELSGTTECKAFADGMLFFKLENDDELYLEFEYMSKRYTTRFFNFKEQLVHLEEPRYRNKNGELRDYLSTFIINLAECINEIIEQNGRFSVDYCLHHIVNIPESSKPLQGYISIVHRYACQTLLQTNFMGSDFPLIPYVRDFHVMR